MSPGEEAAYGREVIDTGKLVALKETFNLTWPVMANLIGVDPASLKMWAEGTRVPSHTSAKKLGVWMAAVRDQYPQFRAEHHPDDVVSLSMASQYLGMSYATVLQKCQARELTCVDLGPLGVFILKSDIPNLVEAGHGKTS